MITKTEAIDLGLVWDKNVNPALYQQQSKGVAVFSSRQDVVDNIQSEFIDGAQLGDSIPANEPKVCGLYVPVQS